MVKPRKEFILEILGRKVQGGWHNRLRQILIGVSETLTEFPSIDLNKFHDLAIARDQRHYEILGSVTAKLSRGIEDYFDYLPNVIKTISASQIIIKYIHGKDPLASFDRFIYLREAYEELKTEYF
jgi:hypothetical protein